MNALDALARETFDWLVGASWQVAMLVLVIALLAWAARGASPGWRYALWLLVLIKLFLPPALTAPWSVGQWAHTAYSEWAAADEIVPSAGSALSIHLRTIDAKVAKPWPLTTGHIAWIVRGSMGVWLTGICVFWAAVTWRCRQLAALVRDSSPIDEGPLRVVYEETALSLGLRSVPDLIATDRLTGPFLCGLAQPCVVLPQSWLHQLTPAELRAVLTHELVHYRRGDVWIGWLNVVGQSLFWFHPLVWWALRELRHARECVCDEAVMRVGGLSAEEYAGSIVRAVTASRGRSLAAGGLVAVVERGGKLQDRLEDIMSFRSSRQEANWFGRLAIAALAVLLLPMGGRVSQAAAGSAPPQLISSNPQNGARDVEASLSEISVTFDRDMSSGMSWTGGSPDFPPLDESRKAAWRARRTCVLPVKLAGGAYYRVGINSSGFQNFKSAEGVAVEPVVIAFTTKGATAEIQDQLRAPKIAKLQPANGAMDVDPATTELKVTFDVPMGGGMSWTGGGEQFPKLPESMKASWSADELTCTLPVKLEPGHDYQLGLNSPRFKNFQSKTGVPLEPVVYKFRTRDK